MAATPKAITLTLIDLPTQAPGRPASRAKLTIPVSRIDEVHEAMVGDYSEGQFQPHAVNCGLLIKVNGERHYVEEKPARVCDLINGLT